MTTTNKLLFIFSVFLVVSCGTNQKVVTTEKNSSRKIIEREKPTPITQVEEEPAKPVFKNAVEEYIYTYAETAKKSMAAHGIPASITLAQGILESGAGQGDLVRRSNNHFGIKCHEWEGDRVYHDDDRSQECFRKYDDPAGSFNDHSLFLTQRSRYANLFKLKKDDYVGWAKGLRAAGYATDRKYPDKLISLIERYQLYQYDKEVLSGKVNYTKAEIASRDIEPVQYIVKKGDTLYSISKKHGVSVEELRRSNNLRGNNLSIGQLLHIKSQD